MDDVVLLLEGGEREVVEVEEERGGEKNVKDYKM